MKKKIFIYIFLSFVWCNITNAIPTNDNGQGDLILTEDIIKKFHSYIKTKIQDNPINFFITQDHKGVFVEIKKNAQYKGYSGSGPIARNKRKCESKYKKKCFLFANQRVIVWNNGINPIDGKKSKIGRKISYDELIIKLKELGFTETKSQKAAKENKVVEEKESKDILILALQQVTKPNHRTAWVLRHLEGCSIAEISGILKRKEGTVKIWIFRCTQELRQIMVRNGFSQLSHLES